MANRWHNIDETGTTYKENVTHQHEGVDGGFVVDGGMTLMTVSNN